MDEGIEKMWYIYTREYYVAIKKEFCSFLKVLFIFRERGREGERGREKHGCVRETLISCLSLAPNWQPIL